MSDPAILTSLRGEPGLKVATVTISNPEALNALTTPMQLQFIDTITDLESDDQVRGIIIRGAGEKAFCAGGSMESLSEIQTPADGEAMYQRGVKMRDTILNMKKPTIAAVAGWCIGGGFEIALSCDLIYASEDARFGMTEVDVGLVPGWGGAIRLPRRTNLDPGQGDAAAGHPALRPGGRPSRGSSTGSSTSRTSLPRWTGSWTPSSASPPWRSRASGRSSAWGPWTPASRRPGRSSTG